MWPQVFNTPKTSGQVLPHTHPPINSVPRAALPPELKQLLREAITYFPLVSRLRMHGEYLQFFTCFHVINFFKFTFTYLIIYLLFLIIQHFYCEFLTSSTKIKRQLDFYEMSGTYLDMEARIHNMYFDTTKF